MRALRRLAEAANVPLDLAGLAYFRVIFGLALMWESWRYLSRPWIQRYFVDPPFLFTYWPFDFVRPWPEPFMTLHFLGIGLAALGVALGAWYRLSASALFVLFTYVFLLDKARYLNHFYLVCLLSFLLVWLPANRAFSVDAWRNPSLRASTAPAWTLWLVRFQVGVPYFFGGIAKMNADWIAGEPMRAWLRTRTDFPILGPLFRHEPVVQAFSWGGLWFDLLVVPLVLFRRTRVIGMVWMMVFHLLNSRLFKIGIFPWMMILATLVFLRPDWPRRLWDDLRRGERRTLRFVAVGGLLGLAIGSVLPAQPDPMNALIAAFGMGVMCWDMANRGWDASPIALPKGAFVSMRRAWLAPVGLWVAVQVLLPLRHLAIPGDASWTEEGHRFAWHMKLRDKSLARLEFVVERPGQPPIVVDPREELAPHQYRKMGKTPDMIVQYAHYLRERLDAPDASVRVRTMVSLNGRRPQLLVDPERDLTPITIPWRAPADWILPLEEPLRREKRRRTATQDDG